MAPSTLGTCLRAFTFGHVRQLEAVNGHALERAWAAGAAPDDARAHSRHRLHDLRGRRTRQAGRGVWLHPGCSATCFAANDLLARAQAIGCVGQMRRATPKRSDTDCCTSPPASHPPDATQPPPRPTLAWTRALLDAIARVRTAFASLGVTATPTAKAAL